MLKPAQRAKLDLFLRLHSARRFDDLRREAETALALDPRFAFAHEFRGMALSAQRRPAEALASFEAAAGLAPREPQFLENLALCQRELGRFDAAEASFRRALKLKPKDPTLLIALAATLRSAGRAEPARAAIDLVLAADPNHPEALVALGNLLLDAGDAGAAEVAVARARARAPNAPAIAWRYGNCLAALDRHAEAIEIMTRALAAVPNDADGWLALARAHYAIGQAAEAFECAARAQALDPLGDSGPTLMAYSQVVCEWPAWRRVVDIVRDAIGRSAVRAGATSPFWLLSVETAAARQLANARRFASARDKRPIARRAAVAAGDRLRVGILSAHLAQRHPTTVLVMETLRRLDRARIDLHIYDASAEQGAVTLDDVTHRAVFGISDDAAAAIMAADGLHIAIDLDGWIERSRSEILARRPAPVQAQWLGFPGTMGADWIDYIVADPVVVPPGAEGGYSEKVVRLPGAYVPFGTLDVSSVPPTRAAAGLPAEAMVFCSLNQSYKILPDVFDVWMRLLADVPNSVLWLLADNPRATANLTADARRRGLDPARLVFAPKVPQADHIARLRLADLALDTFPCTSHTTARDALAIGLPLVALAGETFASRVSSSLLHAVGLAELCTTTLADYAALARDLGQDADRRLALRARLADARAHASYFDDTVFARRLERALSAMWARHVAGLPPDHLDIAD